ncbi:MAG: hypothetical protein ACK5P6_07570 [Pseudobdellovibrionaceae bacterium]
MKKTFLIGLMLFAPVANAFTLLYPGARGSANPQITIEINSSACPAGLASSKSTFVPSFFLERSSSPKQPTE